MSIKAAVEEKEEDEKKKTYYRRIEHRSYNYVTTVPRPVKGDEASAEVKNGVVTVTIPKAEKARVKKITVKAKG